MAIEAGGEMKALSPGYSYRLMYSNYGEIAQRWAVIHIDDNHPVVLNLIDVKKMIIDLFGAGVQKYYLRT